MNTKKAKKPVYKRVWFWILIVFIILAIAASGSGGGDSSDSSSAGSSQASSAASSSVSETSESEQKEQALPDMTTEQENAYRSAKNYLNMMGFSKSGLIQQLTSQYGDGYERKDAVFAIHLLEKRGEVNWNDEAVKSAREYLNTQAFSKEGLKQQLSSSAGSKYTDHQAAHAVRYLEKHREVNWKKQAVKAAKEYLDVMDMSEAGLIQQLESSAGSKFTHEEAVYGARKALQSK